MKRSELKEIIRQEIIREAKFNVTKIKAGDKFKTKKGTIDVTSITVDSIHLTPTVYVEYKYDLSVRRARSRENKKGKEKVTLKNFVDNLKDLYGE